MFENINLPKSRVLSTLGDDRIFTIHGSGIDIFDGNKKYYSTSSIQGTNVMEPEEIITYDKRPSRANMQPKPGVIAFAKMANTLKVIKIDDDFIKDSILSTGFSLVSGEEKLIESNYLFYYFISSLFNNQKDELSTGTTQVAINNEGTVKIQIPVPPLPQQQAIVAEIEKQFSRLDNGLQSLEDIKANLKSYKASVLKSAVEGKLTEERRKQNKDIESASVLLEKILLNKKKKREQANPGKKYKEPQRVNTEELFSLPKGWCRASVEQITNKQEYGSSAKATRDGEIPVLRMGNIQDGKIDFTDLKYFKKGHPDLPKLLLEDKDLLFCRTNGSAELVGKCAIFYKEKFPTECTFAGYLIRVATNSDLFLIEHLYYCLCSPYGRGYINRVKISINQNNVSGEKLSNMPFPLPPLKEQQQIIQEVEEKLSVADVILTTIEANIKRAKQLKQSILHQAFTGQLVPMKDDEKGVQELLAEVEKNQSNACVTEENQES